MVLGFDKRARWSIFVGKWAGVRRATNLNNQQKFLDTHQNCADSGIEQFPSNYTNKYVWSSHTARVRINRVRLPILPVVNSKGKMNFPCPRSRLRIWSRETGSAVPFCVSLLISILRLNLVLTYGIPPDFRAGVYLFI